MGKHFFAAVLAFLIGVSALRALRRALQTVVDATSLEAGVLAVSSGLVAFVGFPAALSVFRLERDRIRRAKMWAGFLFLDLMLREALTRDVAPFDPTLVLSFAATALVLWVLVMCVGSLRDGRAA